jgi:cobalt-zinc-cadmium efflux system outer membrane protein
VTVDFDEGLAPKSNLPGMSVVQALNEALVSGPRAAAVRAQLAISRASYAAGTQATNPVLFMDRGLVAEQVMRLGPVMTLDPPWRLALRLLSAKRIVAEAKINLLTNIWSLRHDVRTAYVEVVVAQETQKTLIQLYDLSNRLAEVTGKRFQAGDVPQLDLLKAQLAKDQALVDVGVGSKRVIRAKQLLNILIGRVPDSPLIIPELPAYTSDQPRTKLRAQKSDILPDFGRDVSSLQSFINSGIQSRLELKSLRAQISVNKVGAQSNYAAIIPNTSFATGKDESGNPPLGPKLTAVFMTLNQELPFTNIQQGGIYQYRAVAKQLKYQITAQQNQVEQDVSTAYNNLLAAREKIRVYQDRLLGDSNEVARLARRSYESGQSDITSTIQAQQLNIQTRQAYLDGVTSYGEAFTDLEFAIGRPLQ